MIDALHTATAVVLLDGVERTLAFPELVRQGQRLAGLEREGEESLLAQRVRLGCYLLQVRGALARKPGRLWPAYLDSLGLHIRTVQMAIRLAVDLGTAHGAIDEARLRTALAGLGEGLVPGERVTLRLAERAVGARRQGWVNPNAKTNHGSFSPEVLSGPHEDEGGTADEDADPLPPISGRGEDDWLPEAPVARLRATGGTPVPRPMAAGVGAAQLTLDGLYEQAEGELRRALATLDTLSGPQLADLAAAVRGVIGAGGGA